MKRNFANQQIFQKSIKKWISHSEEFYVVKQKIELIWRKKTMFVRSLGVTESVQKPIVLVNFSSISTKFYNDSSRNSTDLEVFCLNTKKSLLRNDKFTIFL